MALSIKSQEGDELARELAAATGESITTAVVVALRERLEREQGDHASMIGQRLASLRSELTSLPVLDDRNPDDIIGYDQNGLPT